jgi:hypothetical protein
METDFVFDLSDLKCNASTILLVKRAADLLEKHYPGWAWAVQPDERGGVMNVFSLKLSGEWGWRFLLKDIQGDPKVADRRIVSAGGEILERFGVPRSGYRYESWKGTVKDISGVARADITDKSRSVQRRQRDQALTDALNNGMARLKVKDTPTETGVYREIAIQVGEANGHE